MKFVLTIDCDNDAFAEDLDINIGNILLEVKEDLHNNTWNKKVRDANGNTVGEFKLLKT